MFHSWNAPPPLLKGGGYDLQKIESPGGLPKTLLKRGDNPERGGGLMQKWEVATFLLLYSSIASTVCWGKVNFPLLHFGSSVF